VLLLDVDPQYNLTQMLLRESEYSKLIDSGRSMWNVGTPPSPSSIFQVTSEDMCRVDDGLSYMTDLKSDRVTGGRTAGIKLIPGDFRLARLGLAQSQSALWIAQKRLEATVSASRTQFDVILLDCNPSSSFLTRVAIELATHILVPVRTDRFSVLGLRMMSDYTNRFPLWTNPQSWSSFSMD
jgi:chromosome partitioning protein